MSGPRPGQRGRHPLGPSLAKSIRKARPDSEQAVDSVAAKLDRYLPKGVSLYLLQWGSSTSWTWRGARQPHKLRRMYPDQARDTVHATFGLRPASATLAHDPDMQYIHICLYVCYSWLHTSTIWPARIWGAVHMTLRSGRMRRTRRILAGPGAGVWPDKRTAMA